MKIALYNKGWNAQSPMTFHRHHRWSSFALVHVSQPGDPLNEVPRPLSLQNAGALLPVPKEGVRNFCRNPFHLCFLSKIGVLEMNVILRTYVIEATWYKNCFL
jgi:hypothetical protein